MTFSANIPSTDLASETEYCEIVSGSRVNKGEICRFKIFYGIMVVINRGVGPLWLDPFFNVIPVKARIK